MTGRWPRLYIYQGKNVGRWKRSGARLAHVGNAQGKVVTRRSEGEKGRKGTLFKCLVF